MAKNLAEIAENMEDVNLDAADDKSSDKSEDTGGTTDTGDGTSDGGDGGKSSGGQSDEGGSKDSGSGSEDDDGGNSQAKDGEDSGYIVDEVEEETPETQETKNEPSNLTPELQYIVDRLPVLNVRGRDREGGQIKSFQVKAAGQLPEEFEFASKREEMMFAQSIAAQELAAQRLKGEFDNQVQQENFKKYSDQENEDIRSDMGDLQREGLLPRFQYAPNNRKFETDPGVKQAQEVMDYMNERNQKYSNDKKAYRISFRDAFEQLKSQGKLEPEKDTEQDREDNDRRKVVRQTAGARSTSGGNQGPRPAPSMQALMDRIDNMAD